MAPARYKEVSSTALRTVHYCTAFHYLCIALNFSSFLFSALHYSSLLFSPLLCTALHCSFIVALSMLCFDLIYTALYHITLLRPVINTNVLLLYPIQCCLCTALHCMLPKTLLITQSLATSNHSQTWRNCKTCWSFCSNRELRAEWSWLDTAPAVRISFISWAVQMPAGKIQSLNSALLID